MEASKALKQLKELNRIKLDGLRFRIVDAKDQVVGRLASQISVLLQGKDKPSYNPKKNEGDVVIVVNAAHVQLTWDKWDTKLYRYHTGYPGGLRANTAKALWEKNPSLILTNAVKGMLPPSRTRPRRMEKLKVYPEAEHPFADFDLVPYVPPIRILQDQRLGWPMPQGFEPLNPDRYAYRVLTSPTVARGTARPTVPIGDLLSGEERAALPYLAAAMERAPPVARRKRQGEDEPEEDGHSSGVEQ